MILLLLGSKALLPRVLHNGVPTNQTLKKILFGKPSFMYGKQKILRGGK